MKKVFSKLLVLFACMLFAPNVFASELTENLTLESDSTECYVVKSGSTVTLDLNGHNITCTGTDAIYVENGAELTVKGEGVVQSVTQNMAGLFNNGTVTLNGGTFTADNSITKYYSILNHGIMTINKNVTVSQTNYTTSSLFDNGYYNYDSTNERLGYVEGKGLNTPTLIINGGEFDGGMNTIKNDDNGVLEINGGHFVNNVQVAVMNWNVATINGGTFEVPTGQDKTTLFDGTYGKNSVDKGTLVINGGTYHGEYVLELYKNNYIGDASVTITDGIFVSTVAFLNPNPSRPTWDQLGTKSIKGGLFTDTAIVPDEGYNTVAINQDNDNDGNNDVLVTNAVLQPNTEVNLKVGDTYNAELPKDILKYAELTIDDNSIIDVTNGIIIAKKKGSAKLTVVFGETTQIIDVTVTRVQLEKPTVSGTYQYNGEEQEVILNGFNSDLMTATNNKGSLVNTYTTTVSLKNTDKYEWADGTDTDVNLEWSITKATVSAPTMQKTIYAYTGLLITPEVTGYDENIMNATGDVSATSIGSYSIVYTLKDDNYEWANGLSEVTLDWNIVAEAIEAPTMQTTSYAYTGNVITPEIAGYDENIMNVTGDVSAKDAGTYTIVYTLKDENLGWKNGESEVTLIWTITKVQVEAPTMQTTSYLFTGAPITAEVTGYDEATMDMTGVQTAVDVGTYNIVYTLKDANYEFTNGESEVTLTWKITKNLLLKPTLDPVNYNYTGNAITPTLKDFDENNMTLSGMTMGSSIGEYTVTIALKNKDMYAWEDETTDDLELVWKITFNLPELKASANYNSIKLTWTEVSGSDGYQVYRCNSKGASCTKLTTTKELTYTDKKLKFNKKYYYKVRAYRKYEGYTIFGKFTDLLAKKTALKAPTITVSTNRYRNVLIEWKKVSGATRYYVYRCDEEGNGCKYLGFAYDTDFINKTAEEGVNYIYKVRAYRDGVYGSYSKGVEGLRLSDKIIYSVKNTSYKVNRIIINNVETATKYYIYRATSKNGTYKKIKTITSTGERIVFYDKDLSFNKKYYYKVKITNGVNNSDYSAIKNATTKTLAAPNYSYETDDETVTFTLESVKGATGYHIAVSTDGETYKTLDRFTEKTYEMDFVNNTYVKLRAYRKVGSTYYYGKYTAPILISNEK